MSKVTDFFCPPKKKQEMVHQKKLVNYWCVYPGMLLLDAEADTVSIQWQYACSFIVGTRVNPRIFESADIKNLNTLFVSDPWGPRGIHWPAHWRMFCIHLTWSVKNVLVKNRCPNNGRLFDSNGSPGFWFWLEITNYNYYGALALIGWNPRIFLVVPSFLQL